MTAQPPVAPLVSIVVPTYRRPHYLRRALLSVCAQTFEDFEVLVCDNGDQDEVRELLERIADERFRYCPRPQNVGMLRNALLGFHDARGGLLVKLDDDDTLAPDFLAALTEPLLADRSLSLAFADYELVDDDDHVLVERSAQWSSEKGRAGLAPGVHRPFTRLAADGTVFLAAAVFRRDDVDWGKVPESVATSYDYHVVLQAARDGRGCWFDPRPLMRYRVHPDSDGARHEKQQVEGAIAALEHALAEARHDDPAPLGRMHSDFSRKLARLSMLAGNRTAAKAVLLQALRWRADLRTVRLLVLNPLPRWVKARVLASRTGRERG